MNMGGHLRTQVAADSLTWLSGAAAALRTTSVLCCGMGRQPSSLSIAS